jgi:hypothetical protein
MREGVRRRRSRPPRKRALEGGPRRPTSRKIPIGWRLSGAEPWPASESLQGRKPRVGRGAGDCINARAGAGIRNPRMRIASSTSRLATFSPPVLIMYFIRSTTLIKPSSSTVRDRPNGTSRRGTPPLSSPRPCNSPSSDAASGARGSIFSPASFRIASHRSSSAFSLAVCEYFARSPGSDIWVEFGDLADDTRERLWARHSRKLAFPAGLEGREEDRGR